MVEHAYSTEIPPSAVVWDMDGTLIDSKEAVPAAFIAAVAALDGGPVDPVEVVRAYSLGTPEVILAHLLRRPLQSGEVDRYYEQLRLAEVRPYDGIGDVLEKLNGRVPVAVFTGASVVSAKILLAAAGLERFLPVVVGGDEVARPKPAPDGVLEACRRLSFPPRSVAYIGDAPTDLVAARAAGAIAIAAGWGHLYDRDAPTDFTLPRPDDLLRIFD